MADNPAPHQPPQSATGLLVAVTPKGQLRMLLGYDNDRDYAEWAFREALDSGKAKPQDSIRSVTVPEYDEMCKDSRYRHACRQES